MGDMEVDTSNRLVLFVNGKKVIEEGAEPEWTLLYYLRNKLRLCGTKLGCAEGGCGACTVMVSRVDRKTNKLQHLAVNACLAPVCAMHGLAVTTVEGIGDSKHRLHPIQERLARSHGSQCGFCTPGIVMSMYALLRSAPRSLTLQDLEVAFQGNLCRCTGYRPIIDSFKSFLLEDWEVSRYTNTASNGGTCNGGTCNGGTCGAGDACCKNKFATEEITSSLVERNEFSPYDSSQEPTFPPQLQMYNSLDTEFLRVQGDRMTWYRPVSLEQLLYLKAKFPHARIAVGNTEVGVEVKFKNCFYEVVIQPSQVEQLTAIKLTETGVEFGAAVTLSDMEHTLQEQIKTQPTAKTRVFAALVRMLDLFAGKQIRNVAGIGGNIMTGSPISDLNPIFLAANCQLEVRSKERGSRTLTMDSDFFTGYRKNVVAPDEVLMSITIPYSAQHQHFLAYKQAKRRDDDIAIVNAAFNLGLDPATNKVQNLTMAFGGMSATTVLASNTASKLIGREWNESLLEEAYDLLAQELPLTPDAPGGMVQFRRSLTLSFFFKFYLSVVQEIHGDITPHEHLSATKLFHALPTKSAQYFQVVPKQQSVNDLVGRNVQHVAGYKQASGEAVYCDDIPLIAGELYLTLVLSTRAHATIVSVDASKALALRGVHAFFSSKDVTSCENQHGTIRQDEQVFATDKVTAQGQVIGAIVADNQLVAQRAAKLVIVQYDDLHPVIISIQDAIRENSFFEGCAPRLVRDDITRGFQESDHVLYGEAHIGGQEHFYLETQCTLAVPKDGEMEVFCSTQNPSEVQRAVCHLLGLPQSRVVCRVKRLGGGFGGKESRAVMLALPVALAAARLNRAMRCMLDRDEDMVMTGGRNPFHSRYKVGFSKTGQLTACQMTIYNNAGNTLDLSSSVLERAVFHMDNAYKIPYVEAQGYVCKTNLPSNTAFRGFGGPQAMFMAENYIEDIAAFLELDPAQVRRQNLYEDGDTTHYNQQLSHCTLQTCWDECHTKADYSARKTIIQQYNRENRYKKRGISIIPTKFGIAFTAKFLNQSAALVHIYLDGSVLISHGGVEMGQGLHTKMIQVASRSLGVCDADIHISETATDKVPNTSPTAASAAADLNGMAVMEACEVLNSRLDPYKKANPAGNWKQWVKSAYFDRVSLSATGYHSTPDIGFDWKTQSGNPFNYFTYGVACSEVEIDCLTGDHQVLRTDIVMDLGESLNPAIDVGQIEGGFIQGYGLFTLEEVVYSPKGTLYSRGPGMYKLPGFTDIPAEFNVSLLRGAPNPRAVYSSKAVGEPPLFLAASVFFAIKAAISSARLDVGLSGPFRLDSPATAARIRMACTDNITAKFPAARPGTFTPWNVEP